MWDNVEGQVIRTLNGSIIFDNTVLDKNYSFAIELVRRQYSGNAHAKERNTQHDPDALAKTYLDI